MRFVAVLAGALALSTPALALTAPPAPAASEGAVTQARYLCGPGMTRGPGGYCRPRYNCPPGWRPTPRGLHCVRVY